MILVRAFARKRLSCWVALAAASLAAPAAADAPGETFTCHFGKYGKAVIDTRYPDSTLTIGGRKYDLIDGSYFYQTMDGEVEIFFGPNMRYWEYKGVRDNHCARRANKPLRKRK